MQYEADRANDVAGEPSLAEMTAKAIDVLDNNANGFMLTVEAGRILSPTRIRQNGCSLFGRNPLYFFVGKILRVHSRITDESNN